MNFLLLIYTFIMVSCAKPSNPITWDKCAQEIGQHPCDFTLKDQNGEDFSLYKSYGTPILIEFSAEWCYWCYEAASNIVQLKKLYNFKYVTILLESRTGKPADQQLAKKWADLHGLTDPVVYGWKAEYGWPVEGLPAFYVINNKMEITQILYGWNPQAIEHFINEAQK